MAAKNGVTIQKRGRGKKVVNSKVAANKWL